MGNDRPSSKRKHESKERLTYYDALVMLKRMYPEMSMLEIQRTTLADFEVLIEAYSRRDIHNRFLASYTAFQVVKAQSTNKKGEYIYKTFNKLFDYEEELKIFKEEKTSTKDISIMKRLAEINKGVK